MTLMFNPHCLTVCGEDIGEGPLNAFKDQQAQTHQEARVKIKRREGKGPVHKASFKGQTPVSMFL